jgi:hypothetical protein
MQCGSNATDKTQFLKLKRTIKALTEVTTYHTLFIPPFSGAVRSFGAWSKQSQWLPLTAIMTFKIITLLTDFPFIWLNNLKSI